MTYIPKADIEASKSVAAAFSSGYNGDCNCGIIISERKSLKKLAKRDPLKTIHHAIGYYADWDGFGYEAFPYDRRNARHFMPGIAGDGIGKEPCGLIEDRLPTEDFKEAFLKPEESGYCNRHLYLIGKSDPKSERRDILIALGDIGLRPCSMEWLDGAVHRCMGIPRLGRRGDWGKGWLFANTFPGWEGAKCTTGVLTTVKVMSPSEWRWVLSEGLAVEPWSLHDGCGHEWDWNALENLNAGKPD